MRLEAILLCDSAFQHPTEGKHQLQGVFDRIFVTALPARHRAMSLYFRVFIAEDERSAEGQVVVQLEVERPGNQRERLPEITPSIGADGKVEGVMQLQGFPLRHYGAHKFRLYVNGDEAGCFVFECSQPPQVREGGQGDVTVH